MLDEHHLVVWETRGPYPFEWVQRPQAPQLPLERRRAWSEAQGWRSASPCPRRVDVRSQRSRSPVLRRWSWPEVQLLIPWMTLDYRTSRGKGSWRVQQARGCSLGSFHLPIAEKPWWTTDPGSCISTPRPGFDTPDTAGPKASHLCGTDPERKTLPEARGLARGGRRDLQRDR